MTAAEILTCTERKLSRPRGWVRGWVGHQRVEKGVDEWPHCLLGAAAACATGRENVGYSDANMLPKKLIEALYKELPKNERDWTAIPSKSMMIRRLINFNDRSKNKDRIVELVRRAQLRLK